MSSAESRMVKDVEINGDPEEIICSIDLNIKEEFNEYNSDGEQNNFIGDHFLSETNTKQEHIIFNCQLCQHDFTDEYEFLSHKRKHRREKLCTICNKIYTHNSHLRIHSDIKPYRCSICQQSFTMKQNLQRHQLRRHSALRPHVCNDCGKAFPLREQLKCHSRVHTGERPYSCDLCSRKFSDRSYFGRHMKQHAAVASEAGGEPQRLFSCHICSKSFNSYSNLYGHTRIHAAVKRYICNECGKGFHRNAHLKSHLRVHSKPPKLVPCTKCDRRFSSDRTLKIHIRMKHKNILETSLYNCQHCYQCFISQLYLDEHMKYHTC